MDDAARTARGWRARLAPGRLAFAGVACGLLAACGTSDDLTVNVLVIGESSAPFERGVRLSLAGQLVNSATAEGLVAFDEKGRVVPALADRWIVTDDGQSYIFRLRDGDWLDGTELTALSGRLALREAIAALKGTALGLDLEGIAEIRDMAGRVIEIRLDRPMPHLLQLLAQPELGLRKQGKGAGPMRMRRDKDIAGLVPIDPQDLGKPMVENWKERARTVRVRAMAGSPAVSKFNRGEADLLLGGRIEQFPLASSVGILRGTIQLDPVAGLFGLAVMSDEGFLETPANREALAMAVDREALIAAFGVGGWTASNRIAPATVDGEVQSVEERWGELALDERRALARTRVQAWTASHGGPPRLRIGMPKGPGADTLFTRLRQDFAAIGVEVDRVSIGARPDLLLIDEIARYPLAGWYLNRFNCRVWRGLCSARADDWAVNARTSRDPAESAAMLEQAEAALTEANVFIPFGPPVRWSLVRGNAIGFATNRWGWHPLMPMALLPK